MIHRKCLVTGQVVTQNCSLHVVWLQCTYLSTNLKNSLWVPLRSCIFVIHVWGWFRRYFFFSLLWYIAIQIHDFLKLPLQIFMLLKHLNNHRSQTQECWQLRPCLHTCVFLCTVKWRTHFPISLTLDHSEVL